MKLKLFACIFILNTYLVYPQIDNLNTETSLLFSGSGNCTLCHDSDGEALVDSRNNDLSIVQAWRGTMMANAARDPFWQAMVENEAATHPRLKSYIEDKCTTCHAPMGRSETVFNWHGGFSMDALTQNELAQDGVSCTVCHQIQPDNLGQAGSFTGNFIIKNDRIIFGPYEDVFTGPMQNHVDYSPEFGAHIQSSDLCGSCHTLFTPIFNAEGSMVRQFPEQATYLEWRNSFYADQNIQCQDCHMPVVTEPIKISSMPPFVGTQNPFWQHTFVGGNTWMPKVLADHSREFETTASVGNFEKTVSKARQQLQQAVSLDVEGKINNRQLELGVNVTNLTGHKFPSGFPSRRAWLQVKVMDSQNQILFESGEYDATGKIKNSENKFHPHYDVISQPDQVQIYEPVLADKNHQETKVLLDAVEYLKDNRIPPKGFNQDENTAVAGLAEYDSSFNFASGSDQVFYHINLSGVQPEIFVEVNLLYQSLKPQFAENISKWEFGSILESNPPIPEVVASKRLTLVLDSSKN